MAYSSIDNGKNFFNTVLYTGNGGTQNITGVGHKPDFNWIKCRSNTSDHALQDIIRGNTKSLQSNTSSADATVTNGVTAFTSDGFNLGAGGDVNTSGRTYCSWNWKAAGANPAKTYVVKVVSDGGNKYRLDDFAANAVTLELSEGGTFTFDQSDSSNNGHPLRFSTTSNGTHGGGSIYTTGVTVSGTPGQAGAKTVIIVAASAPTLYYFCTVHSGMGGQANTPTTNSFTNLDGSIQSNISPATTFSIVSYTGTGSNATVGHGLSTVPKMIIVKKLNGADSWTIYHVSLGPTKKINFDTGAAGTQSDRWNDTSPTSSVFTVGTNNSVNASSGTYIAYCFPDVQGFSKMGSYLGNGNTNGTFAYTGFKPAFTLFKKASSGTGEWFLLDGIRDLFDPVKKVFEANTTSAESTDPDLDYLSNGFKVRTTNGNLNSNGVTYIYMAFAENPFVSAAGIPVTAR